MSLSLAVSIDRLPRFYGYANGTGHGLKVPTDSLTDPLAQADGTTVCGKTLNTARMEEKSEGDKVCKTCVKRITDAMVDAAHTALYAATFPEDVPAQEETPATEGALFGADAVTDTPKAPRKAKGSKRADTAFKVTPDVIAATDAHKATYGTSPEMREVREAHASRMAPAGAFLTIKGKCAEEVAGEDGEPILKAITGRLKLAPVDGSEAVDGNGSPIGACPSCRRMAPLTASGNIGSHNPENLGKAPGLTERATTDVVADAAERKRAAEINAERKRAAEAVKEAKELREESKSAREAGNEGEAERLTALATVTQEGARFTAPRSERAASAPGDQGTDAPRGAALVKGRDSGTLAGPVTVRTAADPAPETDPSQVAGESSRGHASTWDGGIGPERPDRKAVEGAPKAGGRYGDKTEAEVAQLSRAQQRNYWRRVAKAQRRDRAASAKVRDREIAAGVAIPSRERRERRKAASVGSSAAGQLSQSHASAGHGTTADESQRAATVFDALNDDQKTAALVAWNASRAEAAAVMALRVAREAKEVARVASLPSSRKLGKARPARKGRGA